MFLLFQNFSFFFLVLDRKGRETGPLPPLSGFLLYGRFEGVSGSPPLFPRAPTLSGSGAPPERKESLSREGVVKCDNSPPERCRNYQTKEPGRV